LKVIFINRYFAPDISATSQMLSDIAFALPGDGSAICVITSRQRYDAPEARLPRRETIAGVDVHRIPTTHFGRSRLAGRGIDYLTFYLSMAWALLRLARRGDVVVAKTDPPMLSVVAAPIVAMKGARLVNWLQDIFPEVAENIGFGSGRLPGIAYSALRAIRNWSLRRASANVVIGERMAEKLREIGIDEEKIRLIPNFADGATLRPVAHEQNRLRSDWGLNGAFVVGYSGNLGRAHEYETILHAIARTERNAPASGAGAAITWLFVGGGALFEAFREEVRARNLASVIFRPYQPREHLSHSLSAADVHLVSLRPALEGLIVPSKFYGIAAAGRPVIFIGDGDGEIARDIRRFDCGLIVPEGDGCALADSVLSLQQNSSRAVELGQNARRAFDANFDRSVAVGRWRALLEEARA